MPNSAGRPNGAQVAPSELPSLSTQMTFAVGALVVAGLYFARDMLIPITLAVLLSFVLAPIVRLLRGWIGKVASVITAVILAFLIIIAIGGIIGAQISTLAEDLPRYETVIRQKIETVRGATIGRLTHLIDRIDRFQRGDSDLAASQGVTPEHPALTKKAEPGTGEPQASTSPLAMIESLVSPVLNPIATLGIVLVIAVFVLLRQEDLRDRFIRLIGSHDLNRTTTALDDAGRRLSRYFLTQLALNLAFGLVIAIGLYFIGLPSPVLWGIVAALCRFLPYIGAWIAAALPALVAAAVDPGWTMFAATLALFAVTEPLMGQVLEPVVYGHSTGLSPVSIVVATIFWTWLWGPIGLFLATPLTLCLVVLGRHVDRLEFLDVLLGDRPALSPVESFYQRMLAGDPDEAVDQAEVLLKTQSLSAYYDTVALKGLKLAAEDARRGTLDTPRLFQVRDAVHQLIEELDEFDDEEPAAAGSALDAEPPAAPTSPDQEHEAGPPATEPRQSAAAGFGVLCVGGASPLDDAAAAMLGQLLGKHGLTAKRLPDDRSVRMAVTELDPTGISLVCISAIETTNNNGRLRLLIRRLRRRMPDIPVLVGFWPPNERPTDHDSLRATIGADHWTDTLSDAVTHCLDLASKAAEPQSDTAPASPAPTGPTQTPTPVDLPTAAAV
jgi:predicted PurR-regulated permease PerM